MKASKNSGFTLIELVIMIVITTILAGIVINGFIDFRKNQSLKKDTELVVSLLRQARNQTLSSKNSSVYGVHFSSTTITVFTGSSFVENDDENEEHEINSGDTTITATLVGGGSNVIFNRLTGETSQSGTVVLYSPGLSESKTVTIYKTGVIESN